MLLLFLRCVLVSGTDLLSMCLVLQVSVKEDGTLWVLVEQGILGFHGTRWGAVGWWNSGGLVELERQFRAHGLWASGAQRLCGKDIFSDLQGGEPKGVGARVSAASAAPRSAETRDLLGQPQCWLEKWNTGDASPC